MPLERKDRRRCRICGEFYEYPSRRSLATRTCCGGCAQIPAEIRRVLERMRRRMDRLEEQIEKRTEKA